MPSVTQAPLGWYPDPAPLRPGEPPQLRYWDGAQWTGHTYPAITTRVRTTPDGQPLAGWWARAGATMIDSLIIAVVVAAVSFPLYLRLFHQIDGFVRDQIRADRNGTTPPSYLTFEFHHLGTFVAIGAIGLVANLVYSVGFLKWKQATPGKLAVGLRVRLRAKPGPLSWRTVGLHWLGQFGPSVLTLVPFLGLVGLYSLLDSLWPLWDQNRQALHDKLAGTIVVVQRRAVA